MKIITVSALCVIHLFVQDARAQQKLSPNQPVVRSIEPGKTDSYSISLNDGDYVSNSINQQGKVDVIILNPDGSRLRRFPGPQGDGKRQFAFVAEGAGVYSINVANLEGQPSKYELILEKILPLNERFQPTAWTDPYPSPRIQALRQQIARERGNTEAFWRQVAQEGTPLVEPFGTDGKYQLVTFLWRALFDTRNALVLGSFGVPKQNRLDFVMHRLADTDVWYLTLKLPKGARFSYRLSPNDPLVLDGYRADQRRATSQADPLNPHRWGCDPGDPKFDCVSIAELPGATPQPWMLKKAGNPEGKVETRQIRSEIPKARSFNLHLYAAGLPT